MRESNRLDLTFLERALSQFDLSLSEHVAEPERRANRDSVLVHFLLTYELVIQAIKRYLELESLRSSDALDMSFQTMIRRADGLGLLRTGWPEFSSFREARNAIAHTYDEQRAVKVVAVAKQFAGEARFLLDNLKRRMNDGD